MKERQVSGQYGDMKYDTIEEALRSVWDNDDFVNGMKAVYLKDDDDKMFFKEFIESNTDITADEILMIAIEKKNGRE